MSGREGLVGGWGVLVSKSKDFVHVFLAHKGKLSKEVAVVYANMAVRGWRLASAMYQMGNKKGTQQNGSRTLKKSIYSKNSMCIA